MDDAADGAVSVPHPAPLDDIDRRIVRELVADGRIPVRTLAEKVHISRSQMYARLEKLHVSGVIERYTAVVSHEKLGLGTAAFIALSIDQEATEAVIERLRSLPYVESHYLLAGNFEILALVRAPSQSALSEMIIQKLQNVPGVQATRTWLIFREEQSDEVS